MKKIIPIITLLLMIGCGDKKVENGNAKEESDFEKLRDSLKLDSTCVFISYDKDSLHYNKDIRALFYKTAGKQDTFYYAVPNNDSIFLWAIVSGTHTRLIRDLQNANKKENFYSQRGG